MFRVLWYVGGLLLSVVSLGLQAASIPPNYAERIEEESKAFIDCTSLDEREQIICTRLETARVLAREIPLQVFDRHEGRGRQTRVIKYREFVILAYDAVREYFHHVLLAMPVQVGKEGDFPILIRMPSDAPYEITRLRGRSLNKLALSIRYAGRELVPYAGKHLLFKDAPKKGEMSFQQVVYLSTPSQLVTPSLAQAGHALLMRAITRSVEELRENQVPSRAYPGRLLADTVNPVAVANLLLAEQTDPCFLQVRPKGCERLIPVRPYLHDDEVRDAVKTEFVINGLAAFRHMQSIAKAGGSLQFTNNRTKLYVGTYTVTQQYYPKAAIDPSFERGVLSVTNLAKAAIALIDHELAERGLPNWVRELFLRDYEFGLIFPGSAYNGGASQAKLLASLVERFAKGRGLALDTLTFDTFPWKEFQQFLVQGKPSLYEQTQGYIEKIINNCRYLRRYQPMPTTDSEGVLA